jgi:hypothetical protein
MPRASKLSHLEVFERGRGSRVWDERKTQVARWLNMIASVLHYDIGIYYVDEKLLAFIRKCFLRDGKPTNCSEEYFLAF